MTTLAPVPAGAQEPVEWILPLGEYHPTEPMAAECRIYVREIGEGPTVVMLHGGFGGDGLADAGPSPARRRRPARLLRSARLAPEPLRDPLEALGLALPRRPEDTLQEMSAASTRPEGYDYTADLAALDVPILVVAGDDDFIPLASQRAWTARVPNARLEVVRDAGHLAWIDQPDAVLGAIREYLDDLP